MRCARLFLAACVALTCFGSSAADDSDVGGFLSRCSGLKPVLTGEKEADRDDRRNLSWCTNHLSAILENYRSALGKRNQVAKGVSICLPEGMTDAELLLIVLDELKAQDRSETLAKVITDTLSVWWPCRG
jgi:Rap1a immunity proteins